MNTSRHPATRHDLFGKSLTLALAAAAGLTLPTSAADVRPAASATSDRPRGWLTRLDAWFYHQRQRDREAWLAQSQDIFELERRLRQLERRPHW